MHINPNIRAQSCTRACPYRWRKQLEDTSKKHAWAVGTGTHPVPPPPPSPTYSDDVGKHTHFERHALVHEQIYSPWKAKCSSFSNIRVCPSMWVSMVCHWLCVMCCDLLALILSSLFISTWHRLRQAKAMQQSHHVHQSHGHAHCL